jgi:pyruvate/2-oxoglutarate dehydrogenase complex dihydrolipoamide dehydrogenase (E3) component
VDVLLDAEARRAEREAGGEIRLGVRVKGEERTLAGSHLLVATGRVPNTDRLGLAAGGVATDQRGYVRVNERLETNALGVYALGDVKGGPAFTHISYDDFRVVNANLLEGGRATTRGRLVPYTIYIDPQLGRVGLTELEARAAALLALGAQVVKGRVDAELRRAAGAALQKLVAV